MIKVDVLLVLLFLEFTVLCIVLSLYLFYKNRTYKQLYRKTLREVVSLKSSTAANASGKQDGHAGVGTAGGAAAEKTDGNARYTDVLKEKDLLSAKVAELEKRLEAENKRLDDLQKKHTTLENEYSILYGKHFEGRDKNALA
jgi:hypothetical protein